VILAALVLAGGYGAMRLLGQGRDPGSVQVPPAASSGVIELDATDGGAAAPVASLDTDAEASAPLATATDMDAASDAPDDASPNADAAPDSPRRSVPLDDFEDPWLKRDR